MARSISRAFSLASVTALLCLPGAASAQDGATKDDATTDHAKVVGHIGIGDFGQYDVPLRATGATQPARIVSAGSA